MKRTVLLFMALLLLLSPVYVSAQEDPDFDYERAYQDYVYTVDVYNREHSEYLLAKAQYQQAGTLVSQTKAREETAQMLEARDDVVIIYMTAIRMRLLEAEGVSELTKNGLYSRIDAEIAWFRDHKSRIRSAGTLADLAADSKEAADRFAPAERLAYETLASIPFGKLSLMRSQANSILTSINSKIFEIRENADKNTTIIERWAIEIENKITRSLDKEIEAQALIPNFTASTRNRNPDHRGNYNNIISRLDESRQFLREATRFMQEIIREITTV